MRRVFTIAVIAAFFRIAALLLHSEIKIFSLPTHGWQGFPCRDTGHCA